MLFLRLLILLIYPAAVVVAFFARPRQAAAAARAAGTTIELEIFARSPRAPRLLVWMILAMVVSCLGRAGPALALVVALVTAPIAAAGTLRLLAICKAGVILDHRLLPWSELAGFIADRKRGELLLLARAANTPPTRLALRGALLQGAARALERHLPQLANGS